MLHLHGEKLFPVGEADLPFSWRRTGAGWGGATVSLVREPDVPKFLEAVRAEYYAKRFPDLTEAELNDACFATKPENGAILYENEDASTQAK